MPALARGARIALSVALMAGALLAGPTQVGAGTTSSTLGLSATVPPAVTIQPITLPAITGTSNTSANLVVNLPLGDAFTITLTSGSSGSCAHRSMSDGLGDSIGYNLYTDAGESNIWCGGATGSPIGSTGTGANQTLTFYLVVTTNGAPAGTYSDSLLATISF
jgi:spore coat protein U-like protein